MILIFAVLIQLASCTGSAAQMGGGTGALGAADRTAYFEGVAKYERGAVKVVDLHGTWREMGRQYGKLMASELADVCAVIALITEASGENREKVEATVEIQKNQCPYTVREFFAGAAETSGLSEEELQTANAVERIAGLPKCSAAFAWGDYTDRARSSGGITIYARKFEHAQRLYRLTVLSSRDGSLARRR